MKTKVSLTKCSSYEFPAVFEAVKKTVDLIGGMEKFVKSGEKILVKPNLLGAREPERCVTTHPTVVRSIVRLIKEAGATPLVGDSPGGAVKGIQRVWDKTGMQKLADEEKIELVNFEMCGSFEAKIDHPCLDHIFLTKALHKVDGIINLPKLKTHGLLIYTGAIKNLYGLVPGLRKGEYHKIVPYPKDFGHLLGELFLLVKDKIRFTLIDGIIGMEGNGPSSGDLRKFEILSASGDSLALDTVMTHMLGFKEKKIEPINYLKKRSAGEASLNRIELAGAAPDTFNMKDFKFPSNWFINLVPKVLIKFLGKFIWMKPVIIPELCTSCMLCVESCPVKVIKKNGTAKPVVEPENCISCLCCHELCPHNAIKFRYGVLSKLMIRGADEK